MSFDELPKIAGSHAQSEESVQAIKSVLHLPDFIVREEIVHDYGCDFVVELGVNAEASNFRFQIQLKSEACGTYVDGASDMSVTMKTSRLQYLLRGAGKSIVVGYDQKRRRLYYAWVEEVISNLDSSGPTWRDQETVHVRLPTTNELSKASAQVIHARVLQCGREQLERESRPFEYKEPPSSEARDELVGANDPDELLVLLETKGLALASSGYHTEVLEVLGRVPASRWGYNTSILLVAALAYFHAGLLLQALYYANQAEMALGTLGKEEQALLVHIQLSSKLAMGHIAADVYYQSLARLGDEHPETMIGLQARLETLHYRVKEKRAGLDEWEAIRRLVVEAQSICSGAARNLPVGEVRWGIELILAEIEFDASTILAIQGAFQVRLADKLKRPLPLQERMKGAQRSLTLMKSAATRTMEIYKAARDKGAQEVEGRALLTVVESQLKAHELLSLASPETPGLTDTPAGNQFLEELLGYAARAQAIFAKQGLRTMSFKATRAAANILNVQGEHERRDALIQFLRREAHFLGYHPDKVELETMKRPAGRQPQSDDQATRIAFWMALSNEELKEYSLMILQALGLPDDRLPHFEEEALARKMIAYEQLHHCRHIEILQTDACQFAIHALRVAAVACREVRKARTPVAHRPPRFHGRHIVLQADLLRALHG